MKLGVDIGNTKIALALLNGRKVKLLGGVLTRQTRGKLRKSFENLLRASLIHYPEITKIYIGSVVPSATPIVERVCRSLGLSVFVIGRDLQVPIENRYQNPGQVGMDRLLCAYAAKKIYGYPLIVIDLGTAMTLEIVSESGAYEGGMILPGIQLSLDMLSQRTALLPRVEQVSIPKHLIGRNTQESILSGVLNGYGSMCDGLIEKFLKTHPKTSYKVILTGGYAKLLKTLMKSSVDCIDEFLVFRGMILLADDFKA